MSNNAQNYDAVLKFLVIGDSGVGKTCVLLKYCDDTFTNVHLTTIGIDYKLKQEIIDGKKVKLQIWDTAGQERFKTITQSYYKGATGIILAYSVIDPNSFKNITDWMKQINMHADANVKKIIIANKCDMKDERKVSTKEGEDLAEKYNVNYFETSAKDGLNIREAFRCIAKQAFDTIDFSSLKQQGVISVNGGNKNQQKKEGCC
ncbi:Ras family protein, putative [Ichthyophthirius multifiliis]|uniref:Ras-related protein Rab-1 n=1 Tax=Ichthyophthirius multifiliis TaxID=5932 RepID=G0R2K4_ICHMU|nr:Ras family protein, putative [Ichthyophthirius multifiliis]XP_004037683.1 Ras family protein, putative [Ichthyophthirius multifiliis]EGR28304.1 Ras family protein, putative [Ichthyophthirius multifiliis]EGR33697.1 Ras family protein, putative [Ichthyophthirius multifiliis]|eukprot:XP_004027649.1 Ras family protein, putative [Ichthyophthirius multifiliis]